MSATDLQIDDGWIRSRPTMQVEGGTYSIEDVRELRGAIDDLLGRLGPDGL